MIHSVGTFLKTNITKTMNTLLSDSYILNEGILNDFPDKIRHGFSQTFCTDNNNQAVEIPVIFTYSDIKLHPKGDILIQKKGMTEQDQDQSIGKTVGVTHKQDTHYTREYSYLHYDKSAQLGYLQVKHNPTDVESIDKINNPHKFTRTIKNRIYLASPYATKVARDPDIPNERYKISYYYASSMKHNPKDDYLLEGDNFAEEYTIDVVSSNNDICRCIEALLIATFFSIRLQSPAEQSKYYLPNIREQNADDLKQLNGGFQIFGNKYYIRRFILNYVLTYSLPVKVGMRIKHLLSNPKLKLN